MPPRIRKNERIRLRLDPEAKATITRAAALSDRSLGEFIVSTALERALEIVDRANVLFLNESEAERFVAALANPPAPNARLRQAAKRYEEAIARGELETE